jgi:enamine deaminase RidA (YjgF/YER057c/UK114 family)
MGKPEIVEVPGIKPMGPYSHAVRAGGMLYVAERPGRGLRRRRGRRSRI